MEKLKCIIIDDEKLARDIVINYLSFQDDIEIVCECKNGFEGIKAIQEHKPDIAFLDIQMPKINGFEMLELIDEPPLIIFTTAFDQYAIKAFEINAVDYLLKPFSKDRFDDALNRARNSIPEKLRQDEKIKKLRENIDSKIEYLNRVIIKDRSNIKIIPVQEIDYIIAQDDYVEIHAKGEKYLKQRTMKYYEDHLEPDQFYRIHRSYIININSLKNIELLQKDSYYAVLKDNTKLAISKTGYTKIKNILKT
ncbi:MAG: response regulator [Melioribacteraceae bacterium]|nr:response regulator [Melioribacteraceae bacterium]